MRLCFALIGSAAVAIAPARADFSKDWEAYAAETRAACETFENSLAPSEAPRPILVDAGDGYAWPRGAPGKPHICLYFGYDIDADGAPQNVELLFKGPDNLNYKFVRAGMKTAASRRYQPPGEGEPPSRVVTRIELESAPGWRFRYFIADLPLAADTRLRRAALRLSSALSLHACCDRRFRGAGDGL